jgi:hypothetical protein
MKSEMYGMSLLLFLLGMVSLTAAAPFSVVFFAAAYIAYCTAY